MHIGKDGHAGLSSTPYRRFIEKGTPYLFITPFMISFVVFFLYPSIYSFILSFHSYKGYGNAVFVGFRNYAALLRYRLFWIAIGNTFFYFVLHMVPVMLLSFAIALLLHYNPRNKSTKWYKPAIFLPQIVTIVASALCWRVILSKQYGVINQLLGTQIGFLENPDLIKWSVILLIVWRATGWYMVIYLSGLTTISDEIIDASLIDGATAPQRLYYLIIPMMKPIFLFAFLIDAISSLKIYTEPYVLFGASEGLPISERGETIVGVLIGRLNSGNFGLAAAVGWLLFSIILVVAIFQYVILRPREK